MEAMQRLVEVARDEVAQHSNSHPCSLLLCFSVLPFLPPSLLPSLLPSPPLQALREGILFAGGGLEAEICRARRRQEDGCRAAGRQVQGPGRSRPVKFPPASRVPPD
eukprot:188463-Hanusia_phi.AAC.5